MEKEVLMTSNKSLAEYNLSQVCWLVVGLVGGLTDWKVGWLAVGLIGWLVCWLAGWFVVLLVY